jgi:hypothetical protein
MPRYFFHFVTDSFIVCDHTDGHDLSNDAAARDCAVEAIRATMVGKPWRGLDPLTSSVEATDAKGKLLLRVLFTDVL